MMVPALVHIYSRQLCVLCISSSRVVSCTFYSTQQSPSLLSPLVGLLVVVVSEMAAKVTSPSSTAEESGEWTLEWKCTM